MKPAGEKVTTKYSKDVSLHAKEQNLLPYVFKLHQGCFVFSEQISAKLVMLSDALYQQSWNIIDLTYNEL